MADDKLKKKLTVAPKITELRATEDKKVEIKWKKVPLAEKYAVNRSLVPDGDFEMVDWAKDTGFVDETAEENITYWYKIVAWKKMEGKKVSKKGSTVKAVCVSDIPCVKKLSSKAEKDEIHLDWEKGVGDRYFIYRRCNLFSRMVFAGESNKNSFVDKTAVPGIIYHYLVQTVKSAEEKSLHGNFSAETVCVCLGKTEIISAKATIGNRALLGVRVIAGADGYIFERSDKKDGEFVEVGRTEDITAVNFEEKLPSRFRNYYYRVCAYKRSGETEYRGPYSPVKSVR